MEKKLSSWMQILQIPEDVSISAFVEYDGKVFAVGGRYYDDGSPSGVQLYVSHDNGLTWEDILNIPSELSFASAISVIDGKIFIAGRKGEVQQKWRGATYYCHLEDILNEYSTTQKISL